MPHSQDGRKVAPLEHRSAAPRGANSERRIRSGESLSAEVVLCTYNGAAFITEQLQSVIAQTNAVNKISIYDDRSTDDTVRRIRHFVEQLCFSQRRLFTLRVNPQNLGYAANFANAISNATEDILFLCDQDDVWEARKVETILHVFHTHAPDLVFSDGLLIDESGREVGSRSVLESYGLTSRSLLRFRHHAFDLLLKRNYINGAAAAVRRTAAQSALPLPCEMPHDYWLAIWCSLHNGVVGIPDALYRYRQHQNNVIGAMNSTNPLYVWLGIWRQPNTPRQRELSIWKAVTERIGALPCQQQIEAARNKLDWLSRVVRSDSKNQPRVFEIFKSACDGSYRRHSGSLALLRDLVSLIKG
jgi:glycosyltransferase involved in cell wall biosynthesis